MYVFFIMATRIMATRMIATRIMATKINESTRIYRVFGQFYLLYVQ